MRDPTRVSRVRTQVCDTGHGRRFVFVLVDTDAGVTGVGEASQSGQDAAVVANLRELGAACEGAELFELVERQARGYRSDRAGRAWMVAASGLEIALWDAMGKVLEMPVYRLLGGSCRDRLSCYATVAAGIDDHRPENLAAVAMERLDEGFLGVKIAPFVEWEHAADGLDRRGTLAAGIARLTAVREAIGPDAALMVECNFAFDRSTVAELGRQLAPLDCAWLEAPLWWDDPHELRWLRDRLTQPLASGELLHGRRAYRGLLEAGAVDILQPDVKWTGGILEAKKIAAWAEACQIAVAPHNNSGPVATAASAHLAITLPNAVALETPALHPAWEADLVRGTDVVIDGQVSADRLAARPGLGLDFDEAVAVAVAD